MEPNPSKTKPKGLNLQNKLSNTTKLGKKKESKTNLDAKMHINLRSGSQASQHSPKTMQHESLVEENHAKSKLEKTSPC